MCFRNYIAPYTEEFYGNLGGDICLISQLGQFGKGKYMENIGVGASYRIHSGGIYSAVNQINKNLMRANSYFALYRFYKRNNKIELSHYFIDRYKWTIKESIGIAKKDRKFLKTISLYKLLWRS
jgi:hypothetical protein